MTLKTLGQANPAGSLIVFDRFKIDYNLPKYHNPENETDSDDTGEPKAFKQQSKRHVSDFILTDDEHNIMITPGAATLTVQAKSSWWHRLFRRKPKTEKITSIKYVFDQVLQNPEEIKIHQDRTAVFQELLTRAESAGQVSLIKELKAEQEVRSFESALFAVGLKRYISEPQLLKFVQNCPRGLCLDWVQNFTRLIPADIVAQKVRCDQVGLFDNYCVLHYDPDQKATTRQDREREAADRRDPILFGVMVGSRKLYFIGDWKDDLCDLTLQQVVDKLGADETTEIK
jgi:hypothetical protein